MDIANQLFSLTLGVEPNKQTLQNLAGTLNSAVLSLSEKQKALSEYADTAEAQKFVSQAPIPNQQPQLTQNQIQYIQAAPTAQAAQARKAKILRDPVVWQISQKQMNELQWKRKQLLAANKAELERKKKARAARGPPPKLGAPKSASKPSNQAPAKPPAKTASKPPAKAPAKAPAKPTGKPPAKK